MEKEVLVKVENLTKYFPIYGGVFSRKIADVKAVDNISFEIKKGETYGLVGESGSGKTTAGKTTIRLYEPTAGKIFFKGEEITKLEGEALRRMRKSAQIIFQDPYGSLNPRIPVGDIIGEPLVVHGVRKRKEIEQRVKNIMEIVGLRPEYLKRYAHEFSGGQRQRIGIARALILNPDFIVCDEPISALDVSIQSQIINLLQELQNKFNLTYLFIAHDLAVVRHMSDVIGVMYLGKLVEVAPNQELFTSPLHPYTHALLNAVPIPNPEAKRERKIILGDIPSPINPPSGCRFRTRCPYAIQQCAEIEPPLKSYSKEHYAACIRIGEF
jgi:oligopeptide transport system ATP-binding protein